MKRVLLGPTGVSLLVLVFTAASALGSSFAHDQPRDPRASEQPPPRDFAVVGGTDRVGVHRTTSAGVDFVRTPDACFARSRPAASSVRSTRSP